MTTCSEDGYLFLGSYIRLAFTDGTESSQSVIQSILAVSAMHRAGVQPKTLQLQGASLRALSISASRGITESEAVQHIAANMLLCASEVCLAYLELVGTSKRKQGTNVAAVIRSKQARGHQHLGHQHLGIGTSEMRNDYLR
jgi:hypothetical protein